MRPILTGEPAAGPSSPPRALVSVPEAHRPRVPADPQRGLLERGGPERPLAGGGRVQPQHALLAGPDLVRALREHRPGLDGPAADLDRRRRDQRGPALAGAPAAAAADGR